MTKGRTPFQPRRRVLAALVAGCALAALKPAAVFGQAQPAGKRIALVVGNSDYRDAPLKNPVNDAKAMGSSLAALGFEVILRENTTLRDLIEAMRQFSIRAREAHVRLLYYAGHGIQAKGRNYLLPVDVDIAAEEEVPAKSADVNEVLERLGQAKDGVNIVILDACRNNPFSGSVITGPDGRRLKFRGSAPSGLARMDAPLGTLIAFATSPGGVALDNPGANHSLYTRHLIDNMQTPGMPIEQVFKNVRAAVAQETRRIQVPWEASSLMGDFCFKTAPGGGCAYGAGRLIR